MENTLTITIALPENASLVASIGRETFYETWRAVNTEEDMQLYMKDAFDEEKIAADVLNSKVNIFLLVSEGSKIIGYAKLRNDRTYGEFNGEKAMEIERIYVLSEYQHRKVGTLLMDRCIHIAKSQNYVWLWLGVNDENYKAVNFYKKYHFEVFGNKKFKLGNAEDSDLLMKLSIGS
jgi:ribosomal protein S18 acetylase RimI-like enzyme